MKMTKIVAVSAMIFAPLVVAQEFPSGEEVARQEMAKALAEKARNDRIVEGQRAAEKAAKEKAAKEAEAKQKSEPKATPSPSSKPESRPNNDGPRDTGRGGDRSRGGDGGTINDGVISDRARNTA